MNWLYWTIPLTVIVFLWSLNEALRGKSKEIVAGILALFVFGLCVVAFFLSGWLFGLSALIGSFALANIFHYPATAVARKIMRDPDLVADSYQQKQSEQTMADFGSDDYFLRREIEKRSEATHMEKTVDRALNLKQVQEILEKHSCSGNDLVAFYQRIEIISLPPQMRETALLNANMLDYFLKNSFSGEFNGKYIRNVTDVEISMTLTFWAKHNPGSSEP